MTSKNYLYLVEGETEEKLISVLKTELQVIVPGKVQKFNILQKALPESYVMHFKRNTVVICVFDTDIDHLSLNIFNQNMKMLQNARRIVNHVICIPQVKNLEDELIRSTDIDHIQDLLTSTSIKEYKRDLAQIKRDKLALKLQQHNFQIEKLWTMNPSGQYQRIKNGAEQIKQ